MTGTRKYRRPFVDEETVRREQEPEIEEEKVKVNAPVKHGNRKTGRKKRK